MPLLDFKKVRKLTKKVSDKLHRNRLLFHHIIKDSEMTFRNPSELLNSRQLGSRQRRRWMKMFLLHISTTRKSRAAAPTNPGTGGQTAYLSTLILGNHVGRMTYLLRLKTTSIKLLEVSVTIATGLRIYLKRLQ